MRTLTTSASNVAIASLIAFAATASTTQAAPGPVSTYYLTAGDQTKIHRLTGTTVTSFSAGAAFEYPIAVTSTIRTANIGSTSFGREYTLAGTATGNGPYNYSNIVGDAYDSTTDGTFNYLVGYSTGNVYRTNLDYSNATVLFSGLGSLGFLGITYDPTNNSLWVSGWNTVSIRDYSLSGTLLSSFTPVTPLNGALALDPATNTLWVADRNETGRYREYSKTGTQLQNIVIPVLADQNVLGGEFVVVPEPTSLALLGVTTFLMMRRR